MFKINQFILPHMDGSYKREGEKKLDFAMTRHIKSCGRKIKAPAIGSFNLYVWGRAYSLGNPINSQQKH